MQSPGPILPGPYLGPGLAGLLRANEQQYLFKQQLISAGTSSIAVMLERIKGAAYPFGASLQVNFTNAAGASASPGTFEVDWQNADLDLDAAFVTMQSITLVNTGNYCRIELPLMWASFMRINLKTITNPNIYITAQVSR